MRKPVEWSNKAQSWATEEVKGACWHEHRQQVPCLEHCRGGSLVQTMMGWSETWQGPDLSLSRTGRLSVCKGKALECLTIEGGRLRLQLSRWSVRHKENRPGGRQELSQGAEAGEHPRRSHVETCPDGMAGTSPLCGAVPRRGSFLLRIHLRK